MRHERPPENSRGKQRRRSLEQCFAMRDLSVRGASCLSRSSQSHGVDFRFYACSPSRSSGRRSSSRIHDDGVIAFAQPHRLRSPLARMQAVGWTFPYRECLWNNPSHGSVFSGRLKVRSHLPPSCTMKGKGCCKDARREAVFTRASSLASFV